MSNSVTLWSVVHQTPLYMGFPRQEYWSGLPCPPARDLPDPGIEPVALASPALQADSLPLSHQGSPIYFIHSITSICVPTLIPSSSHHPLGVCTFILLCVCVSISALQIGLSAPWFWIPHMCINIQYLFFSSWLASLYMIVSRSTHVSANGTIF